MFSPPECVQCQSARIQVGPATTITLKPRLVYKGLVILFLSSFQNIITILSRCRNFVGHCLVIGSFDVTNNHHLFPCKHSVPNFDITIHFSPNLITQIPQLKCHCPSFNVLKTKRNLLYMRNQSVPRCKNFPPRL
jgi:hypothetical protein